MSHLGRREARCPMNGRGCPPPINTAHRTARPHSPKTLRSTTVSSIPWPPTPPQCSGWRAHCSSYGPFPPTASPQQHRPLHRHAPPQPRGPQPPHCPLYCLPLLQKHRPLHHRVPLKRQGPQPTTLAPSVAPPPSCTTTPHCRIPPKHTARKCLIRCMTTHPPNNTARCIAMASPHMPRHCSII